MNRIYTSNLTKWMTAYKLSNNLYYVKQFIQLMSNTYILSKHGLFQETYTK